MTCAACGHEHTGLDLAGICIGCPCPHVVVYDFDVSREPFCDADDELWPCPTVSGQPDLTDHVDVIYRIEPA